MEKFKVTADIIADPKKGLEKLVLNITSSNIETARLVANTYILDHLNATPQSDVIVEPVSRLN